MARQKSLTRGRWRAIALSMLLHAAIVAAAVFGWFTWKRQPPPLTTLAIEATVVDERALAAATQPPKPEPKPPEPVPAPEPAPVEEQGPPKPDPAELELKLQEEQKAEKEKLEKEKLDKEKQAQEQERLEAEKQAAAKAAADKAAAEKAAEEKKALEKKKADEAAAAKKAAEEKARQAREAEMRKSIEAEERAAALQNSDAAARWHAAIVAKIQSKWTRPPSAQPGVTCIVQVRQVPGGEVTDARVTSCSIDDEAMRQSVQNAVLNASPLPQPPDPALFERNLELTFAPK